METDEPHEIAQGAYEGILIVNEYMERHLETIDKCPNKDARQIAIYGLYVRALMWTRSFRQLNNSIHIQAIVAGNRALLEILVDTILIHRDDTGEYTSRMNFWEESAMLKAAEKSLLFYKSQNRTLTSFAKEDQEFVIQNKTRIEKQRTILGWVTDKRIPRHPNQWTNQPLEVMVQRIDEMRDDPSMRKMGIESIVAMLDQKTLTESCQCDYPRMHWYVHGSSLLAIRSVDTDQLNSLTMHAFYECANLALLIAKIVLVDLNISAQIPDFEKQIQAIKRNLKQCIVARIASTSELLKPQ